MSDDSASVLGRYATSADREQPLVEVQLLNFPLQLFEQARQHHDELMREFALLALRPPEGRPGHQVPARLRRRIQVLGEQYGGQGDRSDARLDEAIARGETSMDLTYHLPPSAGEAMRHLHELMEEADEFCAAEQLLTLAATTEERDFRRWFIDQFVTQLAGEAPVPYDGPMHNPT